MNDGNGIAPFAFGPREERCACGRLLALLTEEGLEVKCPRCKHMHLLTPETLRHILKDKEPESSDPFVQKPPAGC